ncbi:hypothetical protein DTO027I6_9906 [Penicillium roqueforti]|nr:hypothetical protein CBS147337_9986 [Penicillium roqueforti]KAI3184991.1 hypothetical protein DTO027I6_9906 [Penicillium roqueforti]
MTASEEKAPGLSVNMALGQSNADTSKTPYEMRRQQVRRAQKKHREKKENYVLALEEEVQRLRRTVHTSQQHIRALSDALSSHGISTPDSPATLQPEFNMARVALVGSLGPNSSLKVY